MGKRVRFYLGGSKITADGDCSHEIKRRSLLGRKFSSVQSLSQSFPTLRPHELQHTRLPESTQTHVCWVGDAIQPSHPLPSPSPPSLSLSQQQGLFKWVSSLHWVAKVLEFQLQHQSYQWTTRTDILQNGLDGSSCSPRDSCVFSNTTVQKHNNSSVISFLYSPTLTFKHDYWKTHSLD